MGVGGWVEVGWRLGGGWVEVGLSINSLLIEDIIDYYIIYSRWEEVEEVKMMLYKKEKVFFYFIFLKLFI